MTRPTPNTVLALVAGNACSSLADTLKAWPRGGIAAQSAAACLPGDRRIAIESLVQLAAAGIESETWHVRSGGALSLAVSAIRGEAEILRTAGEALRAWTKAQPDEVEEPWALVDVANEDHKPYLADPGQGYTLDLAAARRMGEDLAYAMSLQFRGAAVPLSRAEATAYPNGKPMAPRDEAPTAATPASPAQVAEAAQEPTVGERTAREWVSAWDAYMVERAGADLAGRIDVAIAEAVREATRAADVHMTEIELERDAYSCKMREANETAASLAQDVADLTESRALTHRDLDKTLAACDVLRRRLARERADNRVAWAQAVKAVTYEARRSIIEEELGEKKG